MTIHSLISEVKVALHQACISNSLDKRQIKGIMEALSDVEAIHMPGKYIEVETMVANWIPAGPGASKDGARIKEETVCQEADRIVLGKRREDYGSPFQNHTRTSRLWADYLGIEISPEDVCLLNILQKISRMRHRVTRDGLVDVCGFARNIEIVQGTDK